MGWRTARRDIEAHEDSLGHSIELDLDAGQTGMVRVVLMGRCLLLLGGVGIESFLGSKRGQKIWPRN